MVYIRKFELEKDRNAFYEIRKERTVLGELFDSVFEFTMNKMEEESIMYFTIIHKETKSILGFCQLDMEDSIRPELGIDIFEKYWNCGYGTMAINLLIEIASEWEHVAGFKWNAVRDNVKSRHIAEKIGGVLIDEKPLYPDAINTFGLENGFFTEDDIVYVCQYEIPKV